ncbi:DsbA family oxidoreductase [Palleronia sediminis]|uniref:DsbA family oxidoreductase n=1 Tax=Palleronia sediminis TaxID=2547833 RepID=A0A4V6PP65_9RHOB|nr:DsbA family oxidoreductase [Palleronia sediminis]TDL79539.1 DsbA family oxidoreductase [Palleronia sediminis]
MTDDFPPSLFPRAGRAAPDRVALDILSDPICPWCYIGKARLDAALAERPDHGFDIAWHPFRLNPEMPRGGMDRAAYLEGKFGGRDGVARAYAPVMEAAEEAGLDIAWDRIARTPDTTDAHRLIHWAGLEGCQQAAVAALFSAYFREGRDIGDSDELCAIARAIGMEDALVARLFASDADRDEIARRDAHARARGVTAVPTFVVAERHVVPGAQPTELWLRVMDDLAALRAT